MTTPIPSSLHSLFKWQSVAVMLGWVSLVTGLFWPLAFWVSTAVLGLMCILYVYVALLGSRFDAPGDSFSIRDFFHLRGVLKLLHQTRTAFAAWTHLLTFDLAIGLGVAWHASHNSMPLALTLPALALTMMFGPAGLLVYGTGAIILAAPIS